MRHNAVLKPINVELNRNYIGLDVTFFFLQILIDANYTQ